MEDFVTRNVVLEKNDIEIVSRMQTAKGLGRRGFSAALRMVIREWAEFIDVAHEKVDDGEKVPQE